MDLKKEIEFIDPDYVATNTALRIKVEKESQENKLTADKINSALVDIFDEELTKRQKQLEEVEEKIFKAQKLLHLVRYVLVTSYYKKNNLEISPEQETVTPGFDKQNRIHPAIKKLLGNNTNLDIFCAGKGKRRLGSKNYNNEDSSPQPIETKRPKLDIKPEVSSNIVNQTDHTLSKNRKKTKHRLVIGNVSKWVPSLEDNTTHKWMMYVRGDKDNPDVSNIIEKVVFYLHPSYKPHDVVEIIESPFHLSRRGWGEFPLRVQLFFKCPLNKPISIVHNLKLEKTFTGRQTLGNETIVDVYLHDNVSKPETITRPPEDSASTSWLDTNAIENSPNNSYSPIKNKSESDCMPLDVSFIKSEPDYYNDLHTSIILKDEPMEIDETFVKIEDMDQIITSADMISTRSDSAYGCSDTASMSFEHDYCDVVEEQFAENKDLFSNQLLLEHSYSVLNGSENQEKVIEHTTETDSVIINGDVCNKLIYGLGETYLKEKVANVHNVVPKNMFQYSYQNPIVNGKKDSVNHLQNIPIVKLPPNGFKNVGQALPYILRRFKLWNKRAQNIEFKCAYPFIAQSKEDFKNWPLGKQLNSEWNRAREIKKILRVHFPKENWNTRACFMYARSHLYDSPVKSMGILFKKASKEVKLINECLNNSSINKLTKKDSEIDLDIDVESDEVTNMKTNRNFIDLSDISEKNQCAFVKEAALDSGVVLKSEEISDGVIMNAAEKMILEAVKCLAEGLIRRANHHLVCSKNYREGISEVTIHEVEIALKERSEIQLIERFQKKKREKDYFT